MERHLERARVTLLSSLALDYWWGEKGNGTGPEDKEWRLSWLTHHTRM